MNHGFAGMHPEISDSNKNDTPASARDALTHAHTETAAETDANTKTVTRLQTGGANTPPIARDETLKARSGGAAGRRSRAKDAAISIALSDLNALDRRDAPLKRADRPSTAKPADLLQKIAVSPAQ
jgi:hypothetical protein